ncbi:MAG: OmpH family outer membrane protein [Gemmatimonadota bacterium]
MRRISFALMALAFLLVSGTAEAQTLRIAYLNSQEVMNAAPGSAEAQAQFDREMQEYQAEIQQLEEEIESLEQQYQQQQLTLSPEARANREQQIQARLQQYQQRGTQLQEQAARRRAELVQPVMDEITEVIEQMREEGNYALILDVAAGSIVSADPALDVTEEVIRRLGERDGASIPGGDRR